MSKPADLHLVVVPASIALVVDGEGGGQKKALSKAKALLSEAFRLVPGLVVNITGEPQPLKTAVVSSKEPAKTDKPKAAAEPEEEEEEPEEEPEEEAEEEAEEEPEEEETEEEAEEEPEEEEQTEEEEEAEPEPEEEEEEPEEEEEEKPAPKKPGKPTFKPKGGKK